jgi:methylmalonyl-CoA mutase N-terminal domain/subunit
VNRFTQEEAAVGNVFRVDDSIRKHQIEKIQRLKSERDNRAVAAALQALSNAAKGKDNLMPFILTAVECYATLGEIADTLRNIFGEY